MFLVSVAVEPFRGLLNIHILTSTSVIIRYHKSYTPIITQQYMPCTVAIVDYPMERRFVHDISCCYCLLYPSILYYKKTVVHCFHR